MREKPGGIFAICLILLLIACRHNTAGTLTYSTLNYDTNRITIFSWDTTIFPKISDPLPLTQEDLGVIDSLLKDAVDSFNIQISPGLYRSFDTKVALDSFIIKQEKYKYQYFPFKDINGDRVVIIIGFSTDFVPWKTEVYQGRLHYGMRKLELHVNLSQKTRDNIITGDFG